MSRMDRHHLVIMNLALLCFQPAPLTHLHWLLLSSCRAQSAVLSGPVQPRVCGHREQRRHLCGRDQPRSVCLQLPVPRAAACMSGMHASAAAQSGISWRSSLRALLLLCRQFVRFQDGRAMVCNGRHCCVLSCSAFYALNLACARGPEVSWRLIVCFDT
jgi:hypothetical protein